MKIIIYSTKEFERHHLNEANKKKHELTFTCEALSPDTAGLSLGHEAVVIFTGDDASTRVIEKLHNTGIKFIATRAAGYDNIDIQKANELGIRIAHVPEYSPYAIAEHAVALVLALNRKITLAHQQVQHYNFTLDNLIGFDLYHKTVGIIGTGRIGSIMTKIFNGFGCQLLGYDVQRNEKLEQNYKLKYTDLNELCQLSDIILLSAPLNSGTKYLINKKVIGVMKHGVMLINTARGAIMNTAHIIEALESGKIGYLGMDVFEREKGIFFFDHSNNKIEDQMLNKLMSFPNVLITPHQAFATNEALENIAGTTLYNMDCWAQNKRSENELVSSSKEANKEYVPTAWGKMKIKKLTHKVIY
ncbi:MAG: 2-hydroxyacid dehydrogenase [Chitinophagaceae bacterium]